ncbi:MAG TPA: hypothetical protein VGM73_04600 [Candidatus Didemnitutus sp.]|jgi:hypothetical protein
MSLTPEQKQTVTSWVAAGDSLSVIQKKLTDQFKVSMTYMDVRFLVDDLGLELKNPAPKVDVSDVTKAAKSAPAAPARAEAKPEKKGLMDRLKKTVGLDDEEEDAAMPAEEAFEDEPEEAAPPVGGTVTVEVDRLIRPGAVVSGSVVFSDGVSAKWALDQTGRLMLDAGKAGYQPSAPDVQAFQRELSRQLQQHGF